MRVKSPLQADSATSGGTPIRACDQAFCLPARTRRFVTLRGTSRGHCGAITAPGQPSSCDQSSRVFSRILVDDARMASAKAHGVPADEPPERRNWRTERMPTMNVSTAGWLPAHGALRSSRGYVPNVRE